MSSNRKSSNNSELPSRPHISDRTKKRRLQREKIGQKNFEELKAQQINTCGSNISDENLSTAKRITCDKLSTNKELDYDTQINLQSMKNDVSLLRNEELNDNSDIVETVEYESLTTHNDFNNDRNSIFEKKTIVNDMLDQECNEDNEECNTDDEDNSPEESANVNDCNEECNDDFDYDFEFNEHIMPDKLLIVLNMIMFYESSVKVKEVFLMIQALYLRFNFSKEARQAILELIKLLAGPAFASLNISQYYMTQFYKVKDDKIYTFFCKDCNIPLKSTLKKNQLKRDEIVCEDCKKKYSLSVTNPYHFVNIDIKQQLMCILSDNKVLQTLIENANDVQRITTNANSNISDIYDGELYKNNQVINSKKENEIVLTLNVNSDGAAVFNKSKYSLWTILFLINELPIHLRFQNIFVAGALYTDHEPNFKLMDLFLTEFFKQNSEYMRSGIKVNSSDGRIFRVIFIPLCFTVDSVARPIISGRIQFSGYWGCHWCYILVVYFAKAVRYTMKNTYPFVYRSHEKCLEEGEKADRSKKLENGVRGTSVITKSITSFDCIWGFPVEYMHGIVLGVTKQLWEEWINTRCPFYLNLQDRQKIDNNLLRIQPIREIYRLPEILKKKGKWKAADWLYWLLFYSLPCLSGILNEKAFNSYALLVKSVNSLLSFKISEADLDDCQKNLLQFVYDCEELYGTHVMTFNLHSLLHLVDNVRKSGPLWSTSAFPFESKIGQLKKFITGPNRVVDQLCNRVSEKVTFEIDVSKLDCENTCYKYCKNLMSKSSLIINYKRSNEDAIVPTDSKQIEKNMFMRCIFRKIAYHSTMYTRPKKTNDTIVQLVDGSAVEIQHFFFEENNCFMRVKYLTMNEVQINSIVLNHLFVIVDKNETICDVSIRNIKTKLILINLNSLEFACIPPPMVDVQ